ncbi:hypothetical protein BH23VER1_BH23VER1_31890 [soil metagenome]
MKLLKSMIAGTLLGLSALAVGAAEDVRIEGAEVGEWTMDFAAASELAEEKDLPLMLNFTGSDWCGWCKLMDKNVFAQEAWKSYAADKVVLVTLDFPNDKSIVPEKYVARNKELAEKFGVRGYPTYVVLDSDGQTRVGQLGAGREKTPESFIEEFETIMKTSPSRVRAYVKANPDKAEEYQAAVAELESAKKAFATWIETGPERNDANIEKADEFKERIDAATKELERF